MIRLAVFDMAHTTVDDRDEVYRVLREATEREGARYTDEQFRHHMGTEKKWAIRRLLEIGGIDATDDRVEQAWQWFRAELRRTYTENPPVALDGVPEALDALRDRGITVALTTGFSREIADLIIDALGWDIGYSAAGDEVAAGRPEPDMIFRVMSEAGISDPAEVISCGDTEADVVSARRAGVTSVGVLTGHLSREDFEELDADLVLDSAADLPDHLVLEAK
ncbi:HAD-IA family hydrolase [Corynebacterium halotolerans]|uniref:Phosphatase n=1 Tax=Corynebacterium halotolerans YIM 70093 = DSM 44683 TaxID=1121362 RepID=M1P023_9CORY|nr:HAD-IA family hydrolase [Corynebacterium halotolerans]AGF73115.1 hypothetical protein A605_10575 [Corynebacterium halotolerans YIM 70093 = DSM 44683]